MSIDDGRVLGVILLVRHGDRQGFYQDPNSYTPFGTALTPLGNQEEYQLGQTLRSIYLNKTSSLYIAGIKTTLVDNSQILARADAGGEGGVIMNSAASLLQGLFPPNPAYQVKLANGTTIFGPLGGYQYIPITLFQVESVEPQNDISLEGWTSCNTFASATNMFYNSSAFRQKEEDHADFLNALPPYMDGRSVTLQNMWNVYDFMNVQYTHNAVFHRALPPTFLEQARDLANWHEYSVFSSPLPGGIGNIAGRTILPSILSGLQRITDPSDPLTLVYQAISYKPFISLFNMTSAAKINPELAGIVNYGGAVALEVRQSIYGGAPMVRFKFKNGTDDADFKTYAFLNGTATNPDVPLSYFINTMQPLAIDSLSAWCNICNNTQSRGCGALRTTTSSMVAAEAGINPLGAGFLGAGLTIAVGLAMLAVLFFLGILAFGRSNSKKSAKSISETGSMSEKV